MTILQIAFLLIAFVTLVSALMVVTSPSMVHAALWLILTLAGIAVLFVLLNASFLAVVQVAVYIDAIAIMIIIVVMLTNNPLRSQMRTVTRTWWGAAIGALILLAGLLVMITQTPAFELQAPALAMEQEQYLKTLGSALVDVNQFILPFEIASVLLLAALIGSITVAWPFLAGRKEEQDR
ncbi:MAG: NADH-quinone oxidoreductase subunit J [Anaerolineales bacterium]|nr:NADH-quinone oxidoreductase subunit J [Anaerolineales bacterium]